MFTRKLGRSGIEVSGLGLGCWAIGGPFWNEMGYPVGWGDVDDAESIRAIHRALGLGVTFFDTANVYGTGYSEKILGEALRGRRDRVVIATKFGRAFEEYSRITIGADARPAAIRQQCEDSLRRLQTDYIDLYQFHLAGYNPDAAPDVVAVCEALVSEGKIRAYAWSTDDVDRARVFAQGDHCAAVQVQINIFERNDAMLDLCAEQNLAAIIRGPLAKGLLTGKFTPGSTLPANDVRSGWNLKDGEQADQLDRLDQLRGVLTQNGRSLAQAALGWLWAKSEHTVPIPGFKTIQQVEDNVGALDYGPLTGEQMGRIESIVGA